MSAAKKKYICYNVGNCEKADAREPFELDPLEDAVCPECRGDNIVESKSGPKLPRGVIIAAVAAATVAMLTFVLFQLSSCSEDTEEYTTPETETVEEPDTTETPEHKKAPESQPNHSAEELLERVWPDKP